MSIFYAYACNLLDDNTSRFVITFANRSVADEWWRAVSMGGNPALSNSIERISPQFYSHNPPIFDVSHFFTNANTKSIAEPFRGKMFFTLQNDRGGRGLSIIPPQNITDHVSGNLFFIRSRSNQNLYWYYDALRGVICTSTEHRTQFGIYATDVPNGTIMIGSDAVNIDIDGQLYVGLDKSGRLVVAEAPWETKFGALADGRITGSGNGDLKFTTRDDSRRHDSWILDQAI